MKKMCLRSLRDYGTRVCATRRWEKRRRSEVTCGKSRLSESIEMHAGASPPQSSRVSLARSLARSLLWHSLARHSKRRACSQVRSEEPCFVSSLEARAHEITFLPHSPLVNISMMTPPLSLELRPLPLPPLIFKTGSLPSMFYDLYSCSFYFCVAICKRCKRQLAEVMADFSVESRLEKTPPLEEPPAAASLESGVVSFYITSSCMGFLANEHSYAAENNTN